MNTKRLFALVLGILMMLPLALNVFAYSSPYTSLQVSETATSKVTISGNSLNFDLFGGASCAPGTKTATASITDATGALHLSNSKTGTATSSNVAYNTGNKGSANTSNAYSQFVSNTEGMTFDLYAKFANLPKLASGMTDTGVVSGNPNNLYFSGVVFNLCSAEKYMADTSKSNNELQAIFAYYDNATLGTNTVLILPYGNRNAFASASAICYFFNTSNTSYDRYTLTFDPVNKTTQFCINGVPQKVNGTGSTTFNNIALCYRATATVNFLNINLNNAQGCVAANNGTYKANIYIDQLNVYPAAIVPNTTNFGFEGDPVPAVENEQMRNAKNLYNDLAPYATDYINPTFWNAFKGWIDYCYDIVESGGEQSELDAACTGTSGNWFMNRLTWLSTAGATATTGGSSVTVAGTGTVLPAATPILINTDRFYISHSSYNGTTDAYGWTNAAVLLTRPGMKMSEYFAYNNDLYSIAYSSSWRAYVCGPTKASGIYQVTEMGYNKDATVPEGGCILVINVNGVANGSVLSSTHNSVLFGDHNERAISAAGIAVGDYVKFEGVTFNSGAAATLSNSGTWYCEGDSRATTPTLNRTASATKETFNGFTPNSYMIEVPASEVQADSSIKVTAEGSGSVSAKVNGSAVASPANFTAALGSTVTVTASGSNFSYWKNAKNGALLSTEAEFSFTAGASALEFVAVFASTGDSSATHTVTFKDSISGKVLGTTTVTSGSTVPTSAIPTATARYGYVFRGWYAGTSDSTAIESYAVTANTTFYARYRSDDAAFFNLTINDGESRTLRVRYAKVAVVTAASSSFTNWTLDGTFYSSQKTVQVSMPNHDCTLASVNNGAATYTPSVSMISNFVDSTGALMTTFVRDLADGYTLVESGILMTRKAATTDLVVDTVVASVTKGISTADATASVFGFIKENITSKAGTWHVRGYLTYKDSAGTVSTVYSDVDSIVVEGTGEVEVQTTFVAMSHNMKNGNTSYSSVASNAAGIGADIVGIQESGSWYYSSLNSAMSNQGYSAIQGSKRDNSLSSEYNPIFYKSSKFTVLDSGTFWLSDTPSSVSKFSGLTYYRICTWAKFEETTTGEILYYFNTHLAATYGTEGLDSVSEVDALRFKQVKVLLEQMDSIVAGNEGTVLLGGDFNMVSTHGIMKYITGSAAYSSEQNTITGSRMRLSRTVAGTTVPNASGNYYTIDATGTLNADFDHIFVSIAGIEVDTYTVGQSAAGSDHLPVYVNCKIK